MQKEPFYRRYPTLAADFAGVLAERDGDKSELSIAKEIVKLSSKTHIRLILQELSNMIENQDIHPDEIQDWANIWLNDSEEKAASWVSSLFKALCKQAEKTHGNSIISTVSLSNYGAFIMEKNIRLALACMDLTTLNDNDTLTSVRNLCGQAFSPAGTVAAVCVYPEFILAARQALHVAGADNVKVATVTNFPHGNDNKDVALRETSLALGAGADEVDLVFPYRAWLKGDKQVGIDMVCECKRLCREYGSSLKVIIETGILKDTSIIKDVSLACIHAGADFIKTSTGKVKINATLEAAETMLLAIKEAGAQDSCGFKAAGGVRTASEASEYLNLARRLMGDRWVNPHNFRFGASSLLDDLLQALGMDISMKKSHY